VESWQVSFKKSLFTAGTVEKRFPEIRGSVLFVGKRSIQLLWKPNPLVRLRTRKQTLGYEADPFERGQDREIEGDITSKFIESEGKKNRRFVIMDLSGRYL